jgi:Ni,Fe-hydrogenase III large subunit
MTTTKYISITNNQVVALADIPVHDYGLFLEINLDLINGHPSRHCVSYFGYHTDSKIKLLCCIADDDLHQIFVSSSLVDSTMPLDSFTFHNHNFEKFEREIRENFGIAYEDHPWLKPLRYAENRADKSELIENYPFYGVDSEELHEVGVGPIHAGIIEPGHFRFICNGEQIMHLEIQLGYQHRGIEQLFLQKKKPLEQATLAESIAGDTVVGHTTAYANLWENLCGYTPDYSLHYARTLALELERIAIHTGDLAGICADIAYQLGNSVYGRLRTPMVNFFQEWGGNRLAKGLIRAGKINFPFTSEHSKRLAEVFDAYEPDFDEITQKLFNLPSALSRMEKTGVVSFDEVLEIGTVGMAARMSGLTRDIRSSHPFNLYNNIDHQPVIKHHGDVYSRVQIRKAEIKQSIAYIKELLKEVPKFNKPENVVLTPQKDKFVISLVEGWRGEICHCAITDESGNLKMYKIKDPSHHNWMALAQAVRNNDISDFPICNKSFNLSYCGHDL